MSEQYKMPPQAVRAMPFRDFVIACINLDYLDDVRAELEPDDGD